MPIVRLSAAVLALAISTGAGATGPAADPAFGRGGTTIYAHSELGGAISSLAFQADGKPVVAGVYRIRTSNRNGIGTQAFVSRLRPDGTTDDTLSGGQIRRDPPIRALVGRDGRIVAGGAGIIARYQRDGSPDAAFNTAAAAATATFADGAAFRDLVLQPDGKPVVAATVANSQGQGGPAIDLVRFNVDGTLDASFDAEGRVRFPVPASYQSFAAMVVLPRGRIGVALTNFVQGSLTASAFRVNADGTLDGSFGVEGSATRPGEVARGIAAQPDGKIVLLTLSGSPGARTVRLTRFTERGEVDATFGDAGVVTERVGDEDATYPITVQPDGRIVVATTHPLRVIRLDKDGARDPAFGEAGVLPVTALRSVETIAIGADGALYLAGASAEPAADAAGRHGNPAIMKLVPTRTARSITRPPRPTPTSSPSASRKQAG